MIGAMKAGSNANANLNPYRADAKPSPARRVLEWWDRHRRSLPWRAEAGRLADPYVVWLSEILLQQTNVATATPYFGRFLALWPRVEALAAAPLEEVMQAFAGLGYYSRARNLHRCAGEIARRGGVFPRTETELRALPGVGAYTAAAIAAIAFGEPASPVDGNIARILARLHAMEAPIARSKGAIAKAAAALTPADRPGDFAQALMDIGAAICTPRNPDCPACPLQFVCAAAATGEPNAYPRKDPARQRPQRAGAAFLALQADGSLLLRTRPPHGLLGGTVELPGTPWSLDYTPDAAASGAPFEAPWRLTPGIVEQAFTHFSLRLNVYFVRLAGAAPAPRDGFWAAQKELEGLAFSSLMRKAVAHGLAFARGERNDEAPLNKRRNGLSTKRRSSP